MRMLLSSSAPPTLAASHAARVRPRRWVRALTTASLALIMSVGAIVATATDAQAQGVLIPTERGIAPLSVKYQRVTIDATEGAANTTVEQVFVNHTNRPLEATYLFPVPAGAVISDFRLMINGKMQRGEVLEKAKAERIYSEIVRRVKDPGIVDWIKPTLFRARVFPVPPRGEQKFRLVYTRALTFSGGTYKVEYPLATASQKAMKTLQDFTLTVNLAHSVPIKAVYSPTHKVAVSRKGDHKVVVGFEGDRVALDKDFLLYFGVSKKRIGMSLLTHRRPGEAGYFMLTAAPKSTFDTKEIQGKAITFVLDTSGSMNGKKMEHAKKALLWSLSQLKSDDRFNVIRFSSDVETMNSGLLVANRANIERAKSFVSAFEAAGGTAIDEALAAAFKQDSGSKTPHMVVFMTDGKPTIGETDIKAIVANAARGNTRKARVFPFGVGDNLNTHLLDKLALAHRGSSEYVKPNEDIEVAMSSLYNKIAFPVLSDVGLELRGVQAYAMLPKAPGDLFRGQQLLIVGRYRGTGDKLVRMTGSLAGTTKTFDFEGTFPAKRSDDRFIAQLWAYRQVGYLLDQVRLNGETHELRQEVIQLAKRFGIVTPYTSYLVVEDTPIAGPRPRPRPRPRPMLHRRPGSASKGGGFGSSANAPAPSEAEEDARNASSKDNFKKQDGAGGVATSKTLRRMKNKSVAQSTVSSVRNASGRAFQYKGGAWVDTMHTTGLKQLKVAPYSAAWLKVARVHPSLRAAMALGERVTIVVGKIALVVTPDGLKTLTTAQLKSLAP